MKIELRDKWIKALRSGRYTQATGKLQKVDNEGEVIGNCCLGVLCRVARFKPVEDIDTGGIYFKKGDLQTGYAYFTNKTINYFGLSNETVVNLTSMNDGFDEQPKSFNEIADWIENNL